LRMLRAVRFTAAFDFQLDDEARAAIVEMAGEINVVSPERIAMEMRRMLCHASRALGMHLMLDAGLAAELLPEIVPHDDLGNRRFDTALKISAKLGPQCGFPLALAAFLHLFVDSAQAAGVCKRWRLSNKEIERTCWLVAHHASLFNALSTRWSTLQPLLIADGIGDLLALTEATSQSGAEAAAFCRKLLDQSAESLDPPPLLTGDDLLAHGIPSGPQYKGLLQRIRVAQLDGEVTTKEQALAMAAAAWTSES
jgi:poly(A) polymerase